MAACGSPSVADITDDLLGLHLLTGGDADGRTVCIQRFKPAAVVNLDIVAVTAAPAVKTVGNGNGAVCGGKDGVLTGKFPPCGVCRQVMREFCPDDFPIYLVGAAVDYERVTLAELLPHSFSAATHMK